jgi:arylsulfatase A-like enzyme
MTIADLFKQAGYHTACVGKWHLGLEWAINQNPKPEDFGEDEKYYADYKPRRSTEPSVDLRAVPPIHGLDIDYWKPIAYGPNQYGFDYFYGLPASLDQPPYVYIENDTVLEAPTSSSGEMNLDRNTATMQDKWQRGPIAPRFDHERVLDDMNDKVLELIEEYSRTEYPFFIYYPTPAVHGPLLPKPEFKGKSGLNAYADVVLQLDDMVGQISAKLKEKGIFEDTVVVFTSDNGCSGVADYPFLLERGHNPSYIFRGKKMSIYEGGHRVPTIVHYPAMITPNTACDSNVCHTDFFRTFTELLNIDVPQAAAEDSFSNLSLWKQTGECERKATIYNCSSGYFGIVSGEWKLACCEQGGDTQKAMNSAFSKKPIEQEFELYNLAEDTGERVNVIDRHPDVVNLLKEELTKSLERGRSTHGTAQENFEPDYLWVQINWK